LGELTAPKLPVAELLTQVEGHQPLTPRLGNSVTFLVD
jgi:hypothetical protein